MNANTIALGSFQLPSGVVQVTDPCYSPNTGLVVNVKPGSWKAEVVVDEHVNTSLTIHHEGYEIDYDSHFKSLSVLDDESTIGVDSGQAGFFESAYYKGGSDEVFYDHMCDLTLNGISAGVYENGAVSSSGYGDGGYSVEGVVINNQYVALRIIFVEENEPEEEIYDQDEPEEHEEETEETQRTEETEVKETTRTSSRYNF